MGLLPPPLPVARRSAAGSGAMTKFLKPSKVVIMLAGRYAGKKAIIVKNFDDGTSARTYGHCLVCGLSKEPRKVIKKTFVKKVNYNHIMPTRYSLDVDLKSVVTSDIVDKDKSSKKVEAMKEAKKLLEEKFKTGKNRWFFSKLHF